MSEIDAKTVELIAEGIMELESRHNSSAAAMIRTAFDEVRGYWLNKLTKLAKAGLAREESLKKCGCACCVRARAAESLTQ